LSVDVGLNMGVHSNFDTCLELYRRRSEFPGLRIELVTEHALSRLVVEFAEGATRFTR
jgi:hypothetical protein